MDEDDLPALRQNLFMCPDFLIHIPRPDERPDHLCYPSLAFWTQHLDAGIRFPLHPFLCEVSRVTRVPLNQFTPSSIRIIHLFYLIVKANGGNPTTLAFRACYDVKRSGSFFYVSSVPKGPAHFIQKPSSIDEQWEKRWFVVTPRSGKWDFPCQNWIYETPHTRRPSLDVIPPSDFEIITLLSFWVRDLKGNFPPQRILRNEDVLKHFGFCPLDPDDLLREMNWATDLVIDMPTLADTRAKAVTVASVGDKQSSEDTGPTRIPSGIELIPGDSGQVLRSASLREKRTLTSEAGNPSKKGKNSRTDKSALAAAKSKDKSQVDEARTRSHDPFTVELPKGFAHLGKEESLSFIKTLETADDRYTFSDHTDEQVERSAAIYLVKFLACYSRLSNRVSPSATADLRNKLSTREQEVVKVTENMSELSLQNDQQSRELNALRDEVALYKKKYEELERSQANFEKERDKAYSLGFSEGVQSCRQRFLKTRSGQFFLKELHEGLIAAYHRSTLYLRNMRPHISHSLGHGFYSALSQAQAQGFTSELDPQLAARTVTTSPTFEGDEQEDWNNPWWLPVMRRAAIHLSDDECITADMSFAKEIWYDTDPPESILRTLGSDHPPALPSIGETDAPELDYVNL